MANSWAQHVPLQVVRTWWYHDMDTLNKLLTLCAGNPPINSWHNGQVIERFDGFFVVWLEKFWNKQSYGWWKETPKHSSDVTKMRDELQATEAFLHVYVHYCGMSLSNMCSMSHKIYKWFYFALFILSFLVNWGARLLIFFRITLLPRG